ncbi:MAG TPA: ferredoxin--NADP reductase [Bacteroidia bacterium]|nr:ferredoxin--NADP reductase [Bacteroidia bacterium]
MSELFYPLRIKRITRETKDAATFAFDIPAELKEKFTYLPGQYLTLSTVINGKEIRRAYSFSSSPITDADPAVTIKKVPGGIFSTYMYDDAFEGQVIQVMPPMGKFTAHVNAVNKKHYVLYAGGSGITPIMSIAKTVLDMELQSRITLIYCNQGADCVIFDQQIKNFEANEGHRFRVIHCFDNPPAGWTGRSGRQNPEDFMALTRETRVDGYSAEYFICGPAGLMDAVKLALATLGVSGDKVHTEYFTSPTGSSPKETVKPAGIPAVYDEEETGGGQKAEITLNGKTREITIPPGVTILEAAKENDLDPPYACQIGVCTTCRARLTEGKVEMDEREGLSDSEIAQGYILTCQSHPTTPKVKLIYE